MDIFDLQNLLPMQPGATSEPFDDPAYIYDITPAGTPCIAYIVPFVGASIRDVEGNRLQAVHMELTNLYKSVQWRCILDGAVNSDTGKPGSYYFTATDILYHGFNMVTDRPLHSRKSLMARVVRRNDILRFSKCTDKDAIRFCATHPGVIAKHKESVYRPADISQDWIRIKPFHDGVYVICGYAVTESGPILILGINRHGMLAYKGKAEQVTAEAFDIIRAHDVYKAPPFPVSAPPETVWIKPELVCEVKHYIDQQGQCHIDFIKLRPDKKLWDCTGGF